MQSSKGKQGEGRGEVKGGGGRARGKKQAPSGKREQNMMENVENEGYREEGRPGGRHRGHGSEEDPQRSALGSAPHRWGPIAEVEGSLDRDGSGEHVSGEEE